MLKKLNEAFKTLNSIWKLSAIIITLSIGLASARGMYTFITKDAPTLFSGLSARLKVVELRAQTLERGLSATDVTHKKDIVDVSEHHEDDIQDISSKLDFLVCLRTERARELEGRTAIQNCESIIF